ncbi:hypothetical protein D3C87_196800 [compost metagenome]
MTSVTENTEPFYLSALVLPVPMDQNPVTAIREKYTVDGKRGLMPHLSLVYPFVRNWDSYQVLKQSLQVFFSQQQPVSITFSSLEKDPTRKLLYLKPSPNKDVDKLMAGCYAIWQEKVPVTFLHLTLAKAKNVEQLHKIELEFGDAVRNLLPFTVEIPQAWFCAERDREWHIFDQLNFKNPSSVESY